MRPLPPLPSRVLRRCEKKRSGALIVHAPPPCTSATPIAARRRRASASRAEHRLKRQPKARKLAWLLADASG